MYFVSDEERRWLTGKLLPRARRQEVHPELRGWSWREAPLSPPYDVRLGVSEIASKYCVTGRDLYLRRVMDVKPLPNDAMREGAILHRVVADLVVRAKAAIYASGTAGCLDALALLPDPDTALPPGWPDPASLRRRARALGSFERHRILSRVQEVLARQPRVGADSLVALALPITVEQQLDGTLLGLSPHLATDAMTAFEPVLFDLKFDRRRDFHRLATTGYALVLESLYEHPVDVGCVVYVRFDGDRVLVDRDLHLVDDELRQWFIDERDERMRSVSEEIDPGFPERCAEDCSYRSHCHRA